MIRLRCKVTLVLLLLLCGCREQIIHNIGELDANQLVSILDSSGLDAEKVRQTDGKWAIAVPEKQVVMAIKLLEKNRVLRKVASLENEKAGVLASREEKLKNFQLIQAGEIERTLSSVSGTLEAHVHLNLESSRDPWSPDKVSPATTAAVLLITDEKCQLTTEQVQKLVSGATGIAADKVAVVFSQVTDAADYTSVPPLTAALSVTAESPVENNPDSHDTGIFRNYRLYLIYTGIILLISGIVINLRRRIAAQRAIRTFRREMAGNNAA